VKENRSTMLLKVHLEPEVMSRNSLDFTASAMALSAFLVKKDGCGLRDERGNRIVDFALCKTISIFSILKIFSSKIT